MKFILQTKSLSMMEMWDYLILSWVIIILRFEISYKII